MIQSSPSQSHADTLHALSQYLSLIQLEGQPSAQLGTAQLKYTCNDKPHPLLINIVYLVTYFLSSIRSKKIMWPHLLTKHDVIIEIEEPPMLLEDINSLDQIKGPVYRELDPIYREFPLI